MGMEIGYKIGNWNGKKWELTGCVWEEIEMQKSFPVVSNTQNIGLYEAIVVVTVALCEH